MSAEPGHALYIQSIKEPTTIEQCYSSHRTDRDHRDLLDSNRAGRTGTLESSTGKRPRDLTEARGEVMDRTALLRKSSSLRAVSVALDYCGATSPGDEGARVDTRMVSVETIAKGSFR